MKNTTVKTQEIFSYLSLPARYQKALNASKELRENLKKQIELQEQLEKGLIEDAKTGRLIDDGNEITEKNYRCEKCGAIKKIKTNHFGTVYGLKCLWSCAPGQGQTRNFIFHDGEVENRECDFYYKFNDGKARHDFALIKGKE